MKISISSYSYGKEKRQTLCFANFGLTKDLNHRKSMTVWKLCKNSSKRDVAGNCSLIRLEMAKVWRKKSLIEKNDHFDFFPMSNFCLFVFFNDAAQDCLSYLLSMSKLKSFKWRQKQIFNSMRFISKLEWRQPMKITVNFLTTHLHPKALSKWVELGHLARSYLKDLSQSFKMITSFCYVFLIAWMWNTP